MQQEVLSESAPTRRQMVYEAAMCKREIGFVYNRLTPEARQEYYEQLLRVRTDLQRLQGKKNGR